MFATIISCNIRFCHTTKVTIEFSNSMLKSEEAILEALNETGTLATGEVLKQFDTN